MSDALARSIPDAAARFSTPPSASVLWCASQPARAMYFNASADSLALNTVDAPNSFAVSDRSFRSSPVAPDIAWTSLIEDSKVLPVSSASAARSLSPSSALRIPSATRFANTPFITVNPSLDSSAAAPASLAPSSRSS